MIGIYMFTNKINNKKYIGQSINIERRYYQHSINSLNEKCLEYSSYFYKAIRKYGFSSFSFEILEECEQEQLDEHEIYWIKYYNTNNSEFGYNLTAGGNAMPDKSKKIYQYDLNKNFIASFKNAYEAAKILGEGFYQSSIQSCASHSNHTKTVNGYIFTYEGDDFSWHDIKQEKEVIRISKDGTKTYFHSRHEAARQSGTYPSNIAKVLKGERKTAGGYRWEEI